MGHGFLRIPVYNMLGRRRGEKEGGGEGGRETGRGRKKTVRLENKERECIV